MIGNFKQSGFTLVEGLLIVLVLSVISFAGYYVWQTQNEEKNTASVAAKQEARTSEGEIKKDETDSWRLYESPDGKSSIRLADGLTLMTDKVGIFLLQHKDVVYKPGSRATVEVTEYGSDNPIGLSIDVGGSYQTDDRATKKGSFKTKTGLTVEKYLFEQTTEPDGIDYPKGAKSYQYVVTKGDAYAAVHYTYMGNGDVETVEKMVKTIEIR